jgi:alpha-galactosidase
MADAASSALLVTEIDLTAEGVVRIRHALSNVGDTPLELASLSTVLPVPERASELLDFTGLWTHERRPQRIPLANGTWARESRHGRPGHDDSFLTVVGAPGFGFRSGEVWATHLAWSGDKSVWAERSTLTAATVLGSGELLAPGELAIAPGSTYESPWTVAVYSTDGIDGLSARLHPWIRSWSTITKPRPVLLNTWEAVYFDHDLERLNGLVEAAASVGVERFVLDDGWFTGRTSDRLALGDWFVDATKWPNGLHPLIASVHAAGMDFGLWVEPEMINDDSDLAREHPDWILGGPSLPTWRFQRVLDLGNPDAFAYILGRLTALLDEYPIAFIKWDHNRDMLTGSPHRQTLALYRLIDAVRAAHPDLEIESCASGGGRIDLGILERVDRVWTSDTNDPLERQLIQRHTGILIPPEYLGGHLGDRVSHTTGRVSDLGFREITALFGSAGIEWDVTRATADERVRIAAWIARYKELRAQLHGGTVVHADPSDAALALHGVVSPSKDSAVFAYVALAAPRTAIPAPIRFVGLDPSTSYRVRALEIGHVIQDTAPAWLTTGEIVLSGRELELVGLPAPLLLPERAALFELVAEL